MFLLLSISILFHIFSSIAKADPLAGYIEDATENEFPFVVSIGRKFDLDYPNVHGHTCGGTLIAEKYVLTCTKCFSINKTKDDYFIYIGSNDLERSIKYEIESWTSFIKWVIKKKNYEFYEFPDNDISVIKLSKEVRLNGISPPKISSRLPTSFVNQNAITAGWGVHFDDITPRILHKTSIRVISKKKCFKNIWNVLKHCKYFHGDNIFCSESNILFVVLDDGDRGSPIFVKNENGYEIIGVNLNSEPAVQNITELPNQRNKHISVYYYREFIKDITNIDYL